MDVCWVRVLLMDVCTLWVCLGMCGQLWLKCILFLLASYYYTWHAIFWHSFHAYKKQSETHNDVIIAHDTLLLGLPFSTMEVTSRFTTKPTIVSLLILRTIWLLVWVGQNHLDLKKPSHSTARFSTDSPLPRYISDAGRRKRPACPCCCVWCRLTCSSALAPLVPGHGSI